MFAVYWIQIMYAVALFLLPTSSAECNILMSGGSEVHFCHMGDIELEVEVQINKATVVNCKKHAISCSTFPNITTTHYGTLPTLTFDQCDLPPSLSCLIERLGASEVKTLRLESCSEVVGMQIADVKGLTALWIMDSETQKTLPFDAMARIPTLKEVRVQSSPFLFTPPSLPNPHLQTLKLITSSVRSVPKGAFRTFGQLTNLNLYGNEIEDLSEGTFEGLENLTYLDLSRNPLGHLRARTFVGAPNIREITFCSTGLEIVENGAFQGLDRLDKVVIERGSKRLTFEEFSLSDLPNVKNITIQSSVLTSLPKNLFNNSKAIVDLTITDCSLEEIPEDIFQDQVKMKRLRLDSNKIKMLPEKLLRSLVSLEELNLTGNLIEALPGKIFEGVINLKYIYIDDNRLTTIPRSTFNGPINLLKLSLNNNHLNLLDDSTDTVSPFGDLEHLEELYLSGNYVDRIFDDWRLSWIHRIRKIDLSKNRIRTLKAQDLDFSGRNLTVDLSYNNITNITIGPNLLREDSIEDKLTSFTLAYNPIACDCHLHSFLKFTRNHNRPRFYLNNTVCRSPLHLAGIKLQDIALDSLKCDIQNCPSSCTCKTCPETSTFELDCLKIPKDFPDPKNYNLTKSKLRLRKFNPINNLPEHVQYLELHGLGLTEVPTVPDTVIELNLAYNNLTVIPEGYFKDNLTVYLAGNEFKCGCWYERQLEALIENQNWIRDYNTTLCEGKLYVHKINLAAICESWWVTVVAGSVVFIAVILSVAVVFVYVYVHEILKYIYKKGWPLPPGVYEDEIDDKNYDVLISYSDKYEKFVMSTLAPMLRRSSYTVCLRCKEWDIGDFLPDKVPDLVNRSRRIVVLLSSDYFESDARLELRSALIKERNCRRKRVLVVRTGDLILDESVEGLLEKRPNLALNDESFWDDLKTQLPRKRDTISKPSQRMRNLLMEQKNQMLCDSKSTLRGL